jgi:hypothetical protein
MILQKEQVHITVYTKEDAQLFIVKFIMDINWHRNSEFRFTDNHLLPLSWRRDYIRFCELFRFGQPEKIDLRSKSRIVGSPEKRDAPTS